MAEGVMNAYLSLIPKLDGSAKSQVAADIEDAGEKGASKFGAALSSGMKTAGKMAGQALLGAMQGLAATAMKSFDAFAQYEQLAGGVEKLFGDAADTVMQFAQDAYATAGMSANEYMETVTGFAASLVSSLGGDTELAAQVANTAIADMADNANTMGTDLAAIQVAYQGFAKGNFSMLDNLKLSYGGSREEMLRLIETANQLREEQGLNADLTIDSYADIVEAIHTVQMDMDLTGKTAEEASGTIQGSLSAVQASWQNLLVGLADDESALGGLVDTFIENVITFAQNALPRLTVIVESIGEMLPTMIDTVIAYLSTDILPLFESLLFTILNHIPDFIQAGVKLLVSIVQDLPNIISQILAVLPDVIGGMIDALLEPKNIMLFIDAGFQLLMGMAEGIINAIPKLIKKALEGLGQLVDGILGWLGIKSPSRVFMEIGDYSMQGFGVGFEDALPDAKTKVHDAIDELTADARAQVDVVASGSFGMAGQSAGSGISIQTVNINADSTTTADSIWRQIRLAAEFA